MKTTSIAKERIKGMVLVAVIAIFGAFLQNAQAQTWGRDADLYFNNQINDKTTIPYVEYALWSIRERTGMSAVYRGITIAESLPNAIVMRWEPQSEFTVCPYCIGYTYWVWDWEGYMVEARIMLNNSYAYTDKMLARVILHEIGHSLAGDIHHSHSGVFYAETLYPYDYALTTADVMELPYRMRSLCHAELTLENDIFIPDIQGKQVMLRYNGNSKWTIATMEDNPYTQGCAVNRVDEDLTLYLDDVRSINGNYIARLGFIGGDTWELEYAE